MEETTISSPGAEDARHLRTLLAERAQRAAELAALYEITAQLTSLRDPDKLLQDIATKAKELLRVDVAYIALDEGERAMRIRVVAGTMGSRLRGLALTHDVGIAGLVFTGGRPFWTEDYTNEPRIQHHTEVDDVARDEQIKGVLGVPLRIHDEVIGVLFAANRDVRPFTDAEVALLSSLAAHAANAIENARLYETQRRATALHERLTRVVVEGGGVTEITEALTEVLGVAVHFSPDAPPRDTARAVAPVSVGDDVLGYVVAARDLGVADRRQLERGALVTALVLVRERALIDSETRARHELVAALINGTGGADVLRRQAQAGGLNPDAIHIVAVVTGADAAELGERAITNFGGLLAARGDEATAILRAEATDDVVAWLRRITTACSVGVAAAVRLDELPAAHAEARRCLAGALALGRVGSVTAAADLGMYRFLLSSAGVADAEDFVTRTIGPLLAADRDKGSDLVHTLDQYLSSGRHHAATAAALFIHANTLYQRLARIGTILGGDWKDPDPDRCLEVQTALRLHRLAQNLNG